MTAADHANAVRRLRGVVDDAKSRGIHATTKIAVADVDALLAALDALQAKSETAEDRLQREQRAADVESDMLTQRCQAAEAERDAAVQAARRMVEQVDTLSKDRVDRNARILELEQAAEQARAALRPFAATVCSHVGEGKDAMKRLQERRDGCAYCRARAALAGNQP